MTLYNGTRINHRIKASVGEMAGVLFSGIRQRARAGRYWPGLLTLPLVLAGGAAHASAVAMNGLAEGVAATDNSYAYVANGFNGLRVIDVAHPRTPGTVGYVRTPDYARRVAAAGHYAYVAASGSGLVVVDVSNPSKPVITGSADTPGSAYDVAVDGHYAYVADGNSGLEIIDVADPKAPQLLATVDTPGLAQGVAVNGGFAYVADGTKGLEVINVSRATAPVIAGSVDTPGDAKGVAVANGHAYVADFDGIQVIDVSDPKTPKIVGNGNSLHDAVAIAAAGHYVYVANSVGSGGINNSAGDLGADVGDGVLQVFDVTDPANPMPVAMVDMQGNATGVALAGHYAYVTQGLSGMQVVDITDPKVAKQVEGFEPAPIP